MDLINKQKITAKKYFAITVVLVSAVLATLLADMQRYVDAPIFGLLFGVIIYNIIPEFHSEFKEGTSFASKKYLSLGIILVGATLNFTQMAASVRALPLILFNICLAFGVAFIFGRFVLKQSNNICTMVGGGTAICGGTAIASIGSIIKANMGEIGYAITAIFLFDIIACIIYPYIAIALNWTPEQFSYIAGASINNTSSVTASAVQYASLMGMEMYATGAVTIKLVRTTMLIIVVLAVALIAFYRQAKNSAKTQDKANIEFKFGKVFPWFVLGFSAMAVLNTFNLFENSFLSEFFRTGSRFMITCALVGVGFTMKFKDLFTKGLKPLLLGGCVWFFVAASTFVFATLMATYVNNTRLFG